MSDLVTEGGVSWRFEVEGEGEALLFLHGWGVDHRIWRQQTKYFSDFFRTVAVDLPGHGATSWKKLSLSAMAEDLMAIFEHLGLRSCHVVASSLGGLVALALSAAQPGILQSVTFAGSMPQFVGTEDFPFGLKAGQIEKLAAQLAKDYPSMVHVFFRSLFTRAERQSRRYKWIQTFRRTQAIPEQQALLEFLAVLEGADLRPLLRSLTCPVLFVNGEGDTIVPAGFMQYVQAELPHARRVLYPETGHLPFLIDPQRFNRTLEEFLSGQTIGGGF